MSPSILIWSRIYKWYTEGHDRNKFASTGHVFKEEVWERFKTPRTPALARAILKPQGTYGKRAHTLTTIKQPGENGQFWKRINMYSLANCICKNDNTWQIATKTQSNQPCQCHVQPLWGVAHFHRHPKGQQVARWKSTLSIGHRPRPPKPQNTARNPKPVVDRGKPPARALRFLVIFHSYPVCIISIYITMI